jgi:benzoate 4-monooxygenase
MLTPSSHTFSAKNIKEFEPYMQDNLVLWVKQWDALIDKEKKLTGKEPEMDCLLHFNFVAFDVSGGGTLLNLTPWTPH